MITQCRVCKAPVEIGRNYPGICTRCGTKIERRQRMHYIDGAVWDRNHEFYFPRYKIAYRFGKAFAVPTRHCSRKPDTRKQAKRRIAKRKKYNHKTGRIPQG